jgi:hypothetical protein
MDMKKWRRGRSLRKLQKEQELEREDIKLIIKYFKS